MNNAGIRRDALLYNMTDDEWREVLQTNLDGAMSMTKAVLPAMMKQRRGAIVNVASLSGLHGVVGQTNYAAAKGALIAMTRSLAREVARSGIRVNCVAPGLVDTDMIATLDAEVKKEMIRAIPMRRAVKPAEVAAAIAFLLSDDASAITGQVFAWTGGRRRKQSADRITHGRVTFQRAVAEASKLPEAEQEAVGAWLLAELESERRWDDLFARSHDMLLEMAAKRFARMRQA